VLVDYSQNYKEEACYLQYLIDHLSCKVLDYHFQMSLVVLEKLDKYLDLVFEGLVGVSGKSS